MADPFYYGKEYCSFYLKTGACQYHDNCSRIHTRPPISNTLILPNMYQRPDLDPTKLQEHFEDFYEDIFEELSHFGDIKSLSVCNNLIDHMIGNVYVVFKEDHQADTALQTFRTRAYCGRPIVVDFMPLRDARFVACKQFVEGRCHRGDFCNFMHERCIGRGLWKKLFGNCRRDYSGGRYCSPRRERSPVREGSDERRARIEMWNRERDGSEERRARIEIWNREREERW